MRIGETFVADTFAEAFRMHYARLLVTACDESWAETAAQEATGYGTSIIACDAEAGVERHLAPEETPDARPGRALLFFGFSPAALGRAVAGRLGQCLMTCPTTAVYDGLPAAAERIPLGRHVRYFGDGFQKSKVVAGRRYWRVPVMDGEFLVEDTAGVEKGVAGGNIIIQAAGLDEALAAARRGVEALRDLEGVITPFPGGVVRSGSKVGSRYRGLRASTNHAFSPALRGRVETELAPGANCAYEIVIDGTGEEAVARAMAAALRAAAGPGVVALSAGNYGGRLGKFHLRLREVLQ